MFLFFCEADENKQTPAKAKKERPNEECSHKRRHCILWYTTCRVPCRQCCCRFLHSLDGGALRSLARVVFAFVPICRLSPTARPRNIRKEDVAIVATCSVDVFDVRGMGVMCILPFVIYDPVSPLLLGRGRCRCRGKESAGIRETTCLEHSTV